MTREELERWCNAFVWDPNAPVLPFRREQLQYSQTTLHTDRVSFYRNCIRLGCFPQPSDGVDASPLAVLVEGHHRAEAWFQEGFVCAPVRVHCVS